MKAIQISLAALAVAALSSAAAQEQQIAGAPLASDQAIPPAPVAEDIPVALLVDLSSGQTLYGREPSRRFVPASVTKVMTAYTAFKLIAEGRLDPEARIRISEELEEEWSGEGSSMFLLAGEEPTVDDLLMGSTTVSGNDATVALAIGATGSVGKWLALMNENARELGMRNSHFGSPNGFPDEGQTYTTAEDLVRLGQAMVTRYPALFDRYIGNHGFTWRGRTQENHDPLIGEVAGADGIKTGFTREAGYTFLGTAERDGRRLMMVLAGAPTALTRNRSARRLLEWGFEHFESERLLDSGAGLGRALVQEGTQSSVELRTASPVFVTRREGSTAPPQMTIRYRGPLPAPIEGGDDVATLRIEVPGMQPVDMPLEAAHSVDKAGFFRRLLNGVEGLIG